MKKIELNLAYPNLGLAQPNLVRSLKLPPLLPTQPHQLLFNAPRIKISVKMDISVNEFYGNIENIGKISVDIFTKISVIKIFHILII